MHRHVRQPENHGQRETADGAGEMSAGTGIFGWQKKSQTVLAGSSQPAYSKSMNRRRPSSASIALWKPKSDGERQRSAARIGASMANPQAAAWRSTRSCTRCQAGWSLSRIQAAASRSERRCVVELHEPRDAALDAGQMLGQRETGLRSDGQILGRRVELVLGSVREKRRRPDRLRPGRSPPPPTPGRE